MQKLLLLEVTFQPFLLLLSIAYLLLLKDLELVLAAHTPCFGRFVAAACGRRLPKWQALLSTPLCLGAWFCLPMHLSTVTTCVP